MTLFGVIARPSRWIPGVDGLDYNPDSDKDVDIATIGVTGTPRFYWDESEDQFRFSKGVVFDAACDVQGTWVATAAWTIPAVTLNNNTLTITGTTLNPYISLINTSNPNGHTWNLTSYSDGTFYLRDATAAADRIAIDTNGVVTWVGTHTGFDANTAIKIAGTQVIGARVVDARCDDVINSGDVTTDGVIDSLRDAMITHGLIAAA